MDETTVQEGSQLRRRDGTDSSHKPLVTALLELLAVVAGAPPTKWETLGASLPV